MGGGRKGIERHHDLPTGGSGALPEVAAVLADAALIGEAAPPPRLDVLVLAATHNFILGVVVVGTCARGGRGSSRPGAPHR